MTDKYIILASSSPRRKEILSSLGLDFEIRPAEIDETPRARENARDYALRLAEEKTRAVARVAEEKLVIGADTIVECDTAILGKPKDWVEAQEMLSMLSGRTHSVITAFCIYKSCSRVHIEAIESRVSFKTITTEEINAYVATGEPLDKAGSYAVQGIGALFVEKVEGSYTNVVGLPARELNTALQMQGVVTTLEG